MNIVLPSQTNKNARYPKLLCTVLIDLAAFNDRPVGHTHLCA